MRQESDGVIEASDHKLGAMRLYCTPSPAPAAPTKGGVVLVDGPSVVPELLFTENETNFEACTALPAPKLAVITRTRRGCIMEKTAHPT